MKDTNWRDLKEIERIIGEAIVANFQELGRVKRLTRMTWLNTEDTEHIEGIIQTMKDTDTIMQYYYDYLVERLSNR